MTSHSFKKSAQARPLSMTLLLVVGTTLSGCHLRGFNNEPLSSAKDMKALCEQGVNIAAYIKPKVSCYQPNKQVTDHIAEFEARRKMYPWIPCNQVELYSQASEAQFDFAHEIHWMSESHKYDVKQLEAALQNPSQQYPDVADHPALVSPSHKAIVDVIRNAKESLFLDAMLFGGAWGTEIIREVLKVKAERNLEVIFLRDTENVFNQGPELNPPWNGLVEYAMKTEGITALRSQIHNRPSAIPFGLNNLLAPLKDLPTGVSILGQSDHSKIVIADGFGKHPAMFVGSKNPSDANLQNYDESAVIRGPAAAAAQAAYIPDLIQAQELALKEKKLSLEDQKLIQRWTQRYETLLKSPNYRVPSAGLSEVRLAENNGDDTVRNAEHTVLQMLLGAKKSIRLYNFLSYNPMVARALVRAAHRIGPDNIRILADGSLTYGTNMTFVRMLEQAANEAAHGNEKIDVSQMVKWRKLTPPIHFPKGSGRIDIYQQQHTKSIVIDDKEILLGSTNFDAPTLSGAFREFSAAVRDAKAAQESAAIFDSIWNNAAKNTLTTAQIRAEKAKETLPPPIEDSVIAVFQTEQARIHALDPRNIEPVDQCW